MSIWRKGIFVTVPLLWRDTTITDTILIKESIELGIVYSFWGLFYYHHGSESCGTQLGRVLEKYLLVLTLGSTCSKKRETLGPILTWKNQSPSTVTDIFQKETPLNSSQVGLLPDDETFKYMCYGANFFLFWKNADEVFTILDECICCKIIIFVSFFQFLHLAIRK